MKTISYDDYLRLCGLLALAADHRKGLEDIGRMTRKLLGDASMGHTDDIVFGGSEGTAADLLALLEITVADPTA